MLEKILKAKHWQIFIIIFGVPFIISLFVNISVFIRIIAGGYDDPYQIFSFMRYFSIILVIATLPLYLWYWAIGTELQKSIPPELRLNTTLFKIFMILAFIIPFFYLISFSFFIEGIKSGMSVYYFWPLAFSTILSFFAAFCIFYGFYFMAKTVKTAELKRTTKFGDFVGEFFLFWFYYIGVWIIQPKINKIMESEENNTDNYISYEDHSNSTFS